MKIPKPKISKNKIHLSMFSLMISSCAIYTLALSAHAQRVDKGFLIYKERK